MARPIKQGLDYFPMDVTTDDKFELIEAKHGLVGFGIIIKLYQKIYKEGCYLEWSEDKLFIFKKNINEDINLINAVIKDAIEYNIFDKSLHKQYNILTSCGIQKRFFAACDRRKSVELIKNYIIVDINSINVSINWINDLNSTQSKVKDSKVDQSKENNDFIKFWNLYPVKVGKLECEKKWNKLNILEKEKIFTTIDEFIKYKPFKDYNHPNPSTYLNQKRWDDEIKHIQQQPTNNGFFR